MDARSLTQRGGDHVKAEVKNPSGALTECMLADKADGTYIVEYTPFENGDAPPSCTVHVMLFTHSLTDAPPPPAPPLRRSQRPGPV